MSTPAGLSPRTISGEVVQPTAMIDPVSEATHGVANVLRTLVTRAVGTFHSEGDMDSALSAIANWEHQMVNPSALRALLEEHGSVAPKEDVTQRQAPMNGYSSQVPVIPGNIDYNKLAAAITAHMQTQAPSADVAPTNQENG
jgi:hypothetical protein